MAPTPLPQSYHLMAHKHVMNPKVRSLFQHVIRSLLYLMLRTYPNIAYAMVALLKHTTKPLKEHLDCAFYICHYLCTYLGHIIIPLYLMVLQRQA